MVYLTLFDVPGQEPAWLGALGCWLDLESCLRGSAVERDEGGVMPAGPHPTAGFSLAVFPAAPAGPAGVGDVARLDEDSALGTAKGQLLVGAQPAALRLFLAAHGLHHVVTAVGDGDHTSMIPDGAPARLHPNY